MDGDVTGSRALKCIGGFAGKPLAGVARVYYQFEGELDTRDGELQLEFEDGSVLFLGGDSTGEMLLARTTGWTDPFEGKLCGENVEYVEHHGRPMLTDVAREEKYDIIVGKAFHRTDPLTNRFGAVVGVQLEFGDVLLNFFVSADDCFVTWGIDDMPRWTDSP